MGKTEMKDCRDRLSQSLVQRNSQETLLLSQQVYDWLIRSAEADLARSSVKTLVFVLERRLRNIPAEAVRHAKLALLRNPLYNCPHFWAPYILMGNWL